MIKDVASSFALCYYYLLWCIVPHFAFCCLLWFIVLCLPPLIVWFITLCFMLVLVVLCRSLPCIDVVCCTFCCGSLSFVCQGHGKPQEQRLKERFNFNFQTMNKPRLCDSKTKTQELRTITQNMQHKCENGYLLLTYANMNMK